MFKNKKAFTIRDFIPALILFAVVVGVLYVMIQSEAINYNNPDIIDPNFEAHYNNLAQLTNNVNGMYNVSNPKTNPAGFELLGAFGTVFKAMISVVGLIFDTLTGFGSQVGYLGQDIGIPPQIFGIVFAGIIAIVVVVVVLIVINSAKFGKL